ncbi:protein stum homolog [Homarus americanus]|uniref:protein stum homolog n=1 Tax=Homarus americanus TaxID=6706 RepID=UPI001C467178|nr:protein stum homolog [Homarus americanus]
MSDINKAENGATNTEAEVTKEEVPKKNGSKHKKDWLAVGGIGIEKRRRSSNASYRIENNKVLIETEDGGVQELEIVATKEKLGTLRKAVPTLPVPLAVLCLVLNLIPGLGTLVSGFAVLCGYPTHYDTKREGVCWNIVAAVLQVILTPIIVGLIWSVQRGVIIVQESLQKKIDERDEKAEEIA